jgi:toxin ParE1/3/4
MNYRLSNKAIFDLREIWHYTQYRWSLAQADKYINLLLNEIDNLAEHPEKGKDFSSIREGYRYAKVKSHLVFYRPQQNQIEIIRILHERMDIENRLEEG